MELTITIWQNSIERCKKSIRFFFVETRNIAEIMGHFRTTGTTTALSTYPISPWDKPVTKVEYKLLPRSFVTSQWLSTFHLLERKQLQHTNWFKEIIRCSAWCNQVCLRQKIIPQTRCVSLSATLSSHTSDSHTTCLCWHLDPRVFYHSQMSSDEMMLVERKRRVKCVLWYETLLPSTNEFP